jgi:2-polyprenyl-6-methoxyphenol hydroxylase-like FAD-dependent oxidoreductase
MGSLHFEKDFEVAIVGGGICGLALACALARTVKTVVFEAAVDLASAIVTNLLQKCRSQHLGRLGLGLD